MIGGDMTIHINSEQASAFKKHFESPAFAEEEHSYKWAVHLLVSGLLSERLIGSESFRSRWGLGQFPSDATFEGEECTSNLT
jgi:hypothetical protein